MQIELTLQRQDKEQPLAFAFTRMINGGYVGRDQEEVRRHIDELACKGIPGPASTPVLYPVIPRTLVTDEIIEVYGDETSGEVEYVLLIQDENTIYVGLGSDHSDRHLEKTDIPRCKQICPNIISKTVWPLSEVHDHWDELLIESRVVKDGEEILYQQGALALILDPEALMDLVRSRIGGPLEQMVIFSGTLGMLTGGFVYAERFVARLSDPTLNRHLELAYDVRPLNYI